MNIIGYRVKEEHLNSVRRVTFYKYFESFEECVNYCSYIVTLDRYAPSKVKFTIFKNNIYVATWESKEYKNANKTKTSNL